MAQYNKVNLKALYDSIFANNTTGDISEEDLRNYVRDMLDSVISNVDNLQTLTTATNTDTYAISGGISSYTNTYAVIVKFTNASTGASTLNVNSLGAKKIYIDPTTQAGNGDIAANGIYILVYDSALDSGTGGFIIVGGIGGGGGGGSGDVTGPGSATSDGLVLFNGTTGKIIKDSVKTLSTDGTFASNSDAKVPTEKAVKTYVDASVTGLLDLKGSTDCSTNPNYPAASKGDSYYVTVAGKIGGASGKSVDVGDVYVASADNAGGTEASVGTSWFVLEHNLVGALLAANNLSDLGSTSTARTNLGLGTGDTPTFDGLLLSGETASRIAIFDGSKNVIAADTATYPNLTELSYLKGLKGTPSTVFIYRNTTASSITGTATETTLHSFLIPAGTMTSTDRLIIEWLISKTGTAGAYNARIRYNTTDTLVGATQISIANPASNILYMKKRRTFTLQSLTSQLCYPTTLSANTDEVAVNTAMSTISINFNNDVYIFLTVNLGSTGDTVTSEAIAGYIN